jgi:hypothetical protein
MIDRTQTFGLQTFGAPAECSGVAGRREFVLRSSFGRMVFEQHRRSIITANVAVRQLCEAR